MPLCHFQFGKPEVAYRPAFGWILRGDQAYGLLFAWTGVAVAPVSLDIVYIGVISVGALGFGLIGIGVIGFRIVGIDVIGFDTSAITYKGYASFSALAWESVFSNGFSIAKDAAIGPIARAPHVINEQIAEIAN